MNKLKKNKAFCKIISHRIFINLGDCKLRSNGMPVPLLRNGYSIFNGTKYR